MAAAESHHEEFEPPSTFDGFAIRGVLGRGAMGKVFLAHELLLDRPVALKMLPSGSAAAERFLTEARAIARLQHPNVVSLYRIGEVQGVPYIAYEYVDGPSLDRAELPLSWANVLEIALGVTRGLSAAHERGVLHRDIKPGNVLRASDGTIKLADFGLAKLDPVTAVGHAFTASEDSRPTLRDTGGDKSHTVIVPPPAPSPRRLPADLAATPLTATGTVMGTPLYIAPELWQGIGATPQSDVYACGLLFWELLVGELPFEGLSLEELAKRSGELPKLESRNVSAPAAFARAIERAVRQAPEERQASAVELLAELEAVAAVFRASRPSSPATRGGVAGMVLASLQRVSLHSDDLYASVYARLFAARPSLRLLFPVDMGSQRLKLASAVRLAIENLNRPDLLVPSLQELGRLHRGYAIREDDMVALGEALLGALREFDKQWTSELESAWESAYAALADAFASGLRTDVVRP